MMTYHILFVTFLTFLSVTVPADHIVMKSKLSLDGEQVHVYLELSQPDDIGFLLVEPQGDVIFKWNAQELGAGNHSLKLNLPDQFIGKFLLRLVSEDENIDQLVYIR